MGWASEAVGQATQYASFFVDEPLRGELSITQHPPLSGIGRARRRVRVAGTEARTIVQLTTSCDIE